MAAQIVSGIGFLGAGMIFMRNQSITGLTTAAGIWATAGIGTAMGAGAEAVGGFCTLLVLLTQLFAAAGVPLAAPAWPGGVMTIAAPGGRNERRAAAV